MRLATIVMSLGVCLSSFAEERAVVKPDHDLTPIALDFASLKVVSEAGSQGRVWSVVAKATAVNPCHVPKSSELYKVTSTSGRDSMLIQVAVRFDRVCTMESDPTPYEIDLGAITHPLDGSFKSIIVNGIELLEK